MSRPDRLPAVMVDVATIAREAPFIRAVLRSYGVQPADLDDVAQDVLLGAWQSVTSGRFRPPPGTLPREALRRWLAGVAFNLSTHYHGRAHRRREMPAGHPIAVLGRASPGPEDQLVARDLLRALRRLPPGCREVVTLAALGAEIHEIADALAIPEGTAGTRLRRGRRLLRRMLTRGLGAR